MRVSNAVFRNPSVLFRKPHDGESADAYIRQFCQHVKTAGTVEHGELYIRVLAGRAYHVHHERSTRDTLNMLAVLSIALIAGLVLKAGIK